MAARIEVKRKSMTKRNRSKVKGKMSRRKVSVKSSGKGVATAAIAKKR